MNILEYIQQFQGIIGAILGSTTTLLITDYIKNRGNLNIYIIEQNYNFLQNTENIFGENEKIEGNDYSRVCAFNISYRLQIYNSSNIPKIMRQIKLNFYNKNNLFYSIVPKDEDTKQFKKVYWTIEDVRVTNINPKEIIELTQSIYIDEKNIDIKLLLDCDKIVLTYINDKNKLEKFNIINSKLIG